MKNASKIGGLGCTSAGPGSRRHALQPLSAAQTETDARGDLRRNLIARCGQAAGKNQLIFAITMMILDFKSLIRTTKPSNVSHKKQARGLPARNSTSCTTGSSPRDVGRPTARESSDQAPNRNRLRGTSGTFQQICRRIKATLHDTLSDPAFLSKKTKQRLRGKNARTWFVKRKESKKVYEI